jgi:hypothetical protein
LRVKYKKSGYHLKQVNYEIDFKIGLPVHTPVISSNPQLLELTSVVSFGGIHPRKNPRKTVRVRAF